MRTDLQMILGPHLQQWFDPATYVAPHIYSELWSTKAIMCDQFGIAPAHIMHKAWDYGTIENLGKLIEAADIPERILEIMIESAGIKIKEGQHLQWQLDPTRNM
jgi:hypothetical protein